MRREADMGTGRLKLSENLSLRSDDGNYLFFDNTSGDVFKLNELSYEMISLCDGDNSEEDVIDKITANFDAPRETIAKDFNELADILLGRHYLVLV